MLVLNKAEKRKKIHLNRKKCPKCCAPLAHKSARKIKTKAYCSSTKPSLVQKPSITVQHSALSHLSSFSGRNTIFPSKERNHWPANYCEGVNRRVDAVQRRDLSSQHQQVKSPQSLKCTHKRQTAPPERRDTNQLLLTLCRTLKSSQAPRQEASAETKKKKHYGKNKKKFIQMPNSSGKL